MSFRILDWLGENLLGWFILIMLFFICIICPIGLYQSINSPTFSLVKSEWDCTENHQYTTTTMVMSGKVMVPIVQTQDECINYKKRLK